VILSAQSGLPFGVVHGGRFNLVLDEDTGDLVNIGGDYNADAQEGDRPDTPSFGNTFSDTPSTSEFINGVFQTSDFPSPAAGSSGNLGKNTFTGPDFRTVDLSLLKNFRLPMSEATLLQFRAEFFNLFNRVNLYLPNINLNGSTFGKSNQAFDAREIQFALKVLF